MRVKSCSWWQNINVGCMSSISVVYVLVNILAATKDCLLIHTIHKLKLCYYKVYNNADTKQHRKLDPNKKHLKKFF